ncbi:MAG: DUF1326 domain-containing protein [Acidobacteriota bacterium]
MKTQMILTAVVVGLVGSSLSAGSSVTGKYVEARTAEVFTGGCIMGSEAETVGRQAVLAWKVDRGSYNGISLDGLSVVAAVAGDRNLGIIEIGGAKANVRSSVFVDDRANAAQRIALVAMATELSKGSVGSVVSVTSTPIQFADQEHAVHVAAGQVALDVSKHIPHDPTCGAMQWFHPLSTIADATIGIADQHSFTGTGLGTKWSDPNKRSAFFGTFAN